MDGGCGLFVMDGGCGLFVMDGGCGLFAMDGGWGLFAMGGGCELSAANGGFDGCPGSGEPAIGSNGHRFGEAAIRDNRDQFLSSRV